MTRYLFTDNDTERDKLKKSLIMMNSVTSSFFTDNDALRDKLTIH